MPACKAAFSTKPGVELSNFLYLLGCVTRDADAIVLDPDLQMQATIREVFRSFRHTGSAFATVVDVRQSGLFVAFQLVNCQKNCHQALFVERSTCSSKARRRCRGNTQRVMSGSPPFGTPFHHLFYSALTVLKCVEHA